MIQNKTVQLMELGLKPYLEALQIQEKCFEGIIKRKRTNRKEEVQIGRASCRERV